MSAYQLFSSQEILNQLQMQLPPRGRVLAIDWGERRVGLALSDETRLVASPLALYERKNREKDCAYVGKIVKDWGVCAVILGLPVHFSGDLSIFAEEVLAFGRKLSLVLGPVPLYFYDERLTTQAVERCLIAADVSRKRRAELVDKLAACYFLQGILDGLHGVGE